MSKKGDYNYLGDDHKLHVGYAVAVSSGSDDADEMVKLNSDGVIDSSMLPGVGDEAFNAEAVEPLVAGDYVNFFDIGGSQKARKANASLGFEANGFVETAFNPGETARILQLGNNSYLSGLTAGSDYFLGDNGEATDTPDDSAAILQRVGKALSDTSIVTKLDQVIVL